MLRFSLVVLLLLAASPGRADTMQDEIRQQLISSCKFWRNCGQYFRPRQFHERHYDLQRWRRMEVTIRPERDERDWRTWREEDWRRMSERNVTWKDRKRDGYSCVGVLVEVLSERRTTVDHALGDAAQKLAAKAQWVHGGQFMNVAEAAQLRYRCGPTDPGDGVASKAAEWGNTIARYVPGTPQRRARIEAREEAREAKQAGEPVDTSKKTDGAFRCEMVAMPCVVERTWREDDDDRRERRTDRRRRR